MDREDFAARIYEGAGRCRCGVSQLLARGGAVLGKSSTSFHQTMVALPAGMFLSSTFCCSLGIRLLILFPYLFSYSAMFLFDVDR